MMGFRMPDLLAWTRSFLAVRYVQQQLSEPWKLIWKCRKTRLNRMRFLKSILYCLILSKLVYVFQRTNYWIVCLLTKRKFP